MAASSIPSGSHGETHRRPEGEHPSALDAPRLTKARDPDLAHFRPDPTRCGHQKFTHYPAAVSSRDFNVIPVGLAVLGNTGEA